MTVRLSRLFVVFAFLVNTFDPVHCTLYTLRVFVQVVVRGTSLFVRMVTVCNDGSSTLFEIKYINFRTQD